MTPLRKFKVKKRYTKGQVKALKKEDKDFEKDTTVYDVLAMEIENINSSAPSIFPTEAEIQQSETGWDEDDEDELEEKQLKAEEQVESSTIIYFLIADPIKGTFDWIDVTQVKYVSEE
jgi:hypothetical protein